MLLLPAGPKFAGATSSFWVYTQKKKIIKILMEFELILPPNLCYTSIVTYILWKLTVLFLSAGPIFAGDTSSFWVYTKKIGKKIIKILMEFELIPPATLCYTSIVTCTLKTYSSISISWTNIRWCYVILSLYRKKGKWINFELIPPLPILYQL